MNFEVFAIAEHPQPPLFWSWNEASFLIANTLGTFVGGTHNLSVAKSSGKLLKAGNIWRFRAPTKEGIC
jgi:hypothetical protein